MACHKWCVGPVKWPVDLDCWGMDLHSYFAPCGICAALELFGHGDVECRNDGLGDIELGDVIGLLCYVCGFGISGVSGAEA